MIHWLTDDPDAPFPPVSTAQEEPDGLLAWGGKLSPQRLLDAYRQGIFPWYTEGDPILWWCPSQRCVFDTGAVHISRSLGRVLRQGQYQVTADLDFGGVLEGCMRGRSDTWITPAMRAAYLEMHALGHGHSFEVWRDDKLVGGMYGLALGRMFFGESMYSLARDASKVAVVTACGVLRQWGFPWLDCQISNPHLESMGARLVPREKFLRRMAQLVTAEPIPSPWTEPFAQARDSA